VKSQNDTQKPIRMPRSCRVHGKNHIARTTGNPTSNGRSASVLIISAATSILDRRQFLIDSSIECSPNLAPDATKVADYTRDINAQQRRAPAQARPGGRRSNRSWSRAQSMQRRLGVRYERNREQVALSRACKLTVLHGGSPALAFHPSFRDFGTFFGTNGRLRILNRPFMRANCLNLKSFSSEPSGTRTRDPLIKSQMLYRPELTARRDKALSNRVFTAPNVSI
jgi:hypothetical protein